MSPNGIGDGSSLNSPAAYQLNAPATTPPTPAPADNYPAVNSWLKDPAYLNYDVKINFKAGTYIIPASGAGGWGHIRIVGTGSRTVTLNGIPDVVTGQLPILKLEASTADSNFNGRWNSEIINRFVIKCAEDPLLFKRDYPKKIVISNLELDGNFLEVSGQAGTGHGAITSEANTAGFRSMPVDVAAQTGLIQNVIIRNFGSIGEVPANPNLQNNSGVESFMVSVHTFVESESYPTHGATPQIPWIIENVEVRDFHSIHGGYGTMIMPHAYQTTWGPANANPYIVVRRCTVMSSIEVAAFGTAGGNRPVVPNLHTTRQTSGRILFQDNVVVNAIHGFNIDTWLVGPVTFENNVFLDVGTLGSFGASQGVAYHKSFKFKDNLIRLRGYLTQKSWSDICVRNGVGSVTDPNLALGRWVPNDSFSDGLFIEGQADGFWFEGNDFTTWPTNNYDLYPPGVNPRTPQYQLIWKVPDDPVSGSPSLEICGMQVATRNDVINVNMLGNRVSMRAYDFGKIEDVPGTGTGNFEVLPPRTSTITDFNGDTEPHVKLRFPVNDGIDSAVAFKPKGQLKRVVPVYSQGQDSRLVAVREVQIGEVTYASGELTVRGRMVQHRMRPADPNNVDQIKTLNMATQLRLRASWNDAAGQSQTQSTFADSNSGNTFIASPKVTGLSGQSGVLRLQLWKDESLSPSGEVGVPSVLDPDVDASAELAFPLAPPSGSSWAGWIGKPSVEITATPDVGDDKNSAVGKRAKLRLRRHGSTVGSLPVRLSLDHTSITKPGTTPPQSLRALYGTPNGDYTLTVSGSGTWALDSSQPSNATLGTATIAAGQSELVLDVVPVTDNLTEYNIIEARILTDPQQNPPQYAPGINTMARVLIFDGPLWTVLPLEGWGPSSETQSIGRAINAGVVTGAGVWTVPPQVVGSVYGSSGSPGGLWTSQSGTLTTAFVTEFRPYGVSFRQYVAGTLTKSKVVGQYVSWAYQVMDDGTGGAALPAVPGAGGVSAAMGISPNGNWTVGYATKGSMLVPALWTSAGTAMDLTTTILNPYSLPITGEAKAVNNAGIIVGYCSGLVISSPIKRPFRNAGNGATLMAGDWMEVPPGGTGAGAAHSVATQGGLHYAAGHFLDETGSSSGVWWIPITGQTLPSTPLDLSTLKRGVVNDLMCEARGINSSRVIVGWSGASTYDPARKAVIYKNGWRDLNDRHFVHGSGSWSLESAEAISDSGFIAGVGTLSGNQKGFLLIPRVNGN